MLQSTIELYKAFSPMDDPKGHFDNLSLETMSIQDIVQWVQERLIHRAWVGHYGVEETSERTEDLALKSVQQKMQKLEVLHPRGVKLFSICRDFSLLTASLLKAKGLATRTRCGFATYFEPEKYVDHWVAEYWHGGEGRWIMVDAQLDPYQSKVLQIDFDPLDVPASRFITAERAWDMCRQNEVDPNLFGIFQWWGLEYVICNLLLEANALMGMPLHPWDQWEGYKSMTMEDYTEEVAFIFDTLANHCKDVDQDFEGLQHFIRHNGKISAESSALMKELV